MAILEMTGIVKQFKTCRALDGVDFAVEAGETVAIIGPSGSGKSTLLRCVNCLEKITSGKIIIDGDTLVDTNNEGKAVYPSEKEIRRICLETGMIFQHFNLFPHMSCIENICYAPIKVRGKTKEEAMATAKDLLEMVGLADKAEAYPVQLSGGQKQRVAIARGLAMEPSILLFDEPTSALDPELTGEILKVIRDLANLKRTMIIVTHEMAFARDVADRIVFMDEGKIVENGTPQAVLSESQNPRIRQFLQRFHDVGQGLQN